MRWDRGTLAAGIKLTVFVVVTSLATGVLAVTIGNIGLGDTHRYTAVFSDVTGLFEGDDVRVSGVRVGEVKDIRVHDGSLAAVTFTVAAERTVFTTTHVVVRYRNLIGQRYVALTEGAGAARPLRPGDTIPLDRTTPALDLTVLFDGFKPLFSALSPDEVNALSWEIIQVLQGEAGTVESLLSRTASLTSTLADRDRVIGDLIDNLNTVLKTVGDRDERLTALIVQLRRLMSGLAEDRHAIGDSLAAIVDLNEQTAGLLDETRADLRTDIAELGKIAGTLDDHEEVVERTIQRMPEKLTDLGRTASYGSWFNFYLCDFEASIILPSGEELPRTSLHHTAARCER